MNHRNELRLQVLKVEDRTIMIFVIDGCCYVELDQTDDSGFLEYYVGEVLSM